MSEIADAASDMPTHLRRPPRRRAAALFLGLVALGALGALALLRGGDPRGSAAAAGPTQPPTTVVTATTERATTTTASTTTTTTTTLPPPLRRPSPADPLVIWTLGDSTAQTVGEAVQIAVRDNPHMTARTSFRISSGLARPDYFNWESFLTLFTLAQKPDVVVISMGANDAQGVTAPDGTVHLFGTPGWKVEYRRRTDTAMKMFTDAGIEVYWMGQPLAADAEYTRWMSAINTVYREAALANPHVHFLNTSAWLSDATGRYAPVLDGVEVRQKDGIHLTHDGGNRVAARVVEAIRRHIAPAPAPAPAPPPPTTTPPVKPPSTTAPAAGPSTTKAPTTTKPPSTTTAP